MNMIIGTVGQPSSRKRPCNFNTLIRIIINQQVSTKAGAAIWKKLSFQLGSFSVKAVLDAGHSGLKKGGLSASKAKYIWDLAQAIRQNKLKFAKLKSLSDVEACNYLMGFKGIGSWTANIFMMSAQCRPDLWPNNDLALQNTICYLFNLYARPGLTDMDLIAERWRPYRSSAAVLLWHYYNRYSMNASCKK